MSDCRLKLKPRKKRATTGCLCCRLRRKKCDERRPTCVACQRNNLLCSWSKSSQHEIVDGATKPKSDFGWRNRLQRGVPTGHRDESRASINHTHPQAVTRIPVSVQPSPLPQGEHGFSQELLSHFISDTAHKIIAVSIMQQENPLLSIAFPWAMSCPLVLHTISAVSGSHLSHKTNNATLKHATLKAYTAAAQSIKYALTSWCPEDTETTLELLAASLLLSQYEVSYSHSDQANLHLLTCR